jgi:hypothetical protein
MQGDAPYVRPRNGKGLHAFVRAASEKSPRQWQSVTVEIPHICSEKRLKAAVPRNGHDRGFVMHDDLLAWGQKTLSTFLSPPIMPSAACGLFV